MRMLSANSGRAKKPTGQTHDAQPAATDASVKGDGETERKREGEMETERQVVCGMRASFNWQFCVCLNKREPKTSILSYCCCCRCCCLLSGASFWVWVSVIISLRVVAPLDSRFPLGTSSIVQVYTVLIKLSFLMVLHAPSGIFSSCPQSRHILSTLDHLSQLINFCVWFCDSFIFSYIFCVFFQANNLQFMRTGSAAFLNYWTLCVESCAEQVKFRWDTYSFLSIDFKYLLFNLFRYMYKQEQLPVVICRIWFKSWSCST